jgi:hypothetical protein
MLHPTPTLRRIAPLVRSGGPWLAATALLGVASVALVLAATTIRIPVLGCALPQPPARVAAWNHAVDQVAQLTGITAWLGAAGFAVGFAGAFVVRRPGALAAYLLLYMLVVGVAYGQDIPNGRCDV